MLPAVECPIDKVAFRTDMSLNLIPNLIVAESLVGLKIYCKYGCKKVDNEWIRDLEGCPEVTSVSKRKQHEDVCLYATVHCTYNPSCPPIR